MRPRDERMGMVGSRPRSSAVMASVRSNRGHNCVRLAKGRGYWYAGPDRGCVPAGVALGMEAAVPDLAGTTTFGALLRRHRLAVGWTQATLAEHAGIAERTIQDLERGAARPRRATIRRLVDALAPSPEVRSALEAVTP